MGEGQVRWGSGDEVQTMGLSKDGEDDGKDHTGRAGRCVETMPGLAPGCKDMVARALC